MRKKNNSDLEREIWMQMPNDSDSMTCEHLLLLSASKLQRCLCAYEYLFNMIFLL